MKQLIGFTGYEQFCAGQDVTSCAFMTEKLAQFKVYSVLDYANEHTTSAMDYNHNATMVLETIEAAKNNPAYPFAVVKPSAIGSFKLYQKMGAGHKLTTIEQFTWTAMQQRFEKLASAAAQATVILMICLLYTSPSPRD